MSNRINCVVWVISVTLIVTSFIFSIAYYNISTNRLMSHNISEAVAKGLDPLSVRCAYAHSTDVVCAAYAASNKTK